MPRWILLFVVGPLSGCATGPDPVELPSLVDGECAGAHGCFRVWFPEGPCTGELDGYVGTGGGSVLFDLEGICTDGSDMAVVIEGQGLRMDIARDAGPPVGTGVVGVGVRRFVNEVGQDFEWLGDRPAAAEDGGFAVDLEPKGSPATRVEAVVTWDQL